MHPFIVLLCRFSERASNNQRKLRCKVFWRVTLTKSFEITRSVCPPIPAKCLNLVGAACGVLWALAFSHAIGENRKNVPGNQGIKWAMGNSEIGNAE